MSDVFSAPEVKETAKSVLKYFDRFFHMKKSIVKISFVFQSLKLVLIKLFTKSTWWLTWVSFGWQLVSCILTPSKKVKGYFIILFIVSPFLGSS